MIDSLINLVSKFIPNQEKADELEAQIQKAHSEALNKSVDAIVSVKMKQVEILREEQRSGAGKWRPRLMYMCMFMILVWFLLYYIAPWFVVTFDLNIYLPAEKELPTELWTFLKIGIGGYITSRGIENVVEKGIAKWKQGK